MIHDTNKVTVTNNVAYEHKGHCIATETGTEEDNRYLHNLVARTRLLPAGQDNGQSDTAGQHNKHQATSYLVRNMRNEFVGNVAAGSVSQCWWTEMRKDRWLNTFNEPQLSTGPVSSFRDNVAHSCKDAGFVTYFRGWKPVGTHHNPGGVLDNMKIYKNPYNGWKSHQTGPIKFTNSLFADNEVHLMYGNGNWEVHLENSVVDDASEDWRVRLGKGCPGGGAGVKHSMNRWATSAERSMAFTNVTFQNFCGGAKMFQLYYDSRSSGRGMGDPIEMVGTKLVNVKEENKPYYGCDWIMRNGFLEDFDGVLGPSGKGPGFIVNNRPANFAFLTPGTCTPIWYSGNNECSVFCEGACLRLMFIRPFFGQLIQQTNLKLDLVKDGGAEYTFNSGTYKDFQILLPAGSYNGRFYEEDGSEIVAQDVEVLPIGDLPLCDDYVEAGQFTFSTRAPTASPTSAPTITSVPTVTSDPIVHISSDATKRYLWVRSDGGFSARADPSPWTNSRITLKQHPCLTEGYHAEKSIAAPCFLVLWEHANGRRMFAQGNKERKNGIGTTAASTIYPDNIWFLEQMPCTSGESSCALIRNAKNGRSMYDHATNLVGASPEGDPSYIWTSDHYRWYFEDLITNTGLDISRWATGPMYP
ncbi:hypothetical protein ACHAWF_011039 [Thalassiosira exigua]